MLIKFYTQAEEILGISQKEVSIDSPICVRDLFQKLHKDLGAVIRPIFDPDSGSITDEYYILLNGSHIMRLQGLDTTIGQDDVLAVIPVTEAG